MSTLSREYISELGRSYDLTYEEKKSKIVEYIKKSGQNYNIDESNGVASIYLNKESQPLVTIKNLKVSQKEDFKERYNLSSIVNQNDLAEEEKKKLIIEQLKKRGENFEVTEKDGKLKIHIHSKKKTIRQSKEDNKKESTVIPEKKETEDKKKLCEVPQWVSKLTPGTYQMSSQSKNDVILHVLPENYKASSTLKPLDISKYNNNMVKSQILPTIRNKSDISDPIILDVSKSSKKDLPKIDLNKTANKPVVFKLQSIDIPKEEKKYVVKEEQKKEEQKTEEPKLEVETSSNIINISDSNKIKELYPRENIEYFLGQCNPHHANGFERSFNPLLRINNRINYFKYKTLKNRLSFYIDEENNKEITDFAFIKSFEKPRGVSSVISDKRIRLNPVKMRFNETIKKKKKRFKILKKINIRFTYKKELYYVEMYPEDIIYSLREKVSDILLVPISRLEGYYNDILINDEDDNKTLEEFFKLERQGNEIVNLEDRVLEVDFVRKYRNSTVGSSIIKQYPYKIIIEDYPNVPNRDLQINILVDDFFARIMMKRDCKVDNNQEKNGFSICFRTPAMAFDFNKFLEFFKKETFLLDSTKITIEMGESLVYKKDLPAYSYTKNMQYYK